MLALEAVKLAISSIARLIHEILLLVEQQRDFGGVSRDRQTPTAASALRRELKQEQEHLHYSTSTPYTS